LEGQQQPCSSQAPSLGGKAPQRAASTIAPQTRLLCKINIVLYLKYIMLNLYILANKLQIIQNVPTPTSFDLSIAADMLLSSGT